MSLTTALGYELLSAPVVTGMSGTPGTGGALDTSANYNYKVTFVTTNGGETAPSNVVGPITTSSTQNAITLNGIPVSSDPYVISRKLYRTEGGGSAYKLLATINDNTTTSYADIIADGSLGAAVPMHSTAMSYAQVKGFMKHNIPLGHGLFAAITAGGTTIADAVPIGLNNFVAVTVGTTNQGVLLPVLSATTIGMVIRIKNTHATNNLKVYPGNSLQTINSGSAGAAVDVAATTTTFIATTATNWQTF